MKNRGYGETPRGRHSLGTLSVWERVFLHNPRVVMTWEDAGVEAVGHKRLIGIVFSALILSACASTAPSSFYTLTPLSEAANRQIPLSDRGVSLGVGPVVFPDFLDRPQIVARTSPNRLEIDEFHRWGGALQDDFLRVLGENLAHLLKTGRVLVYPAEVRFPVDFRIIADVVRFEGSADGMAVLKVRWAVVDPYSERPLVVRESAYRSPVDGDGKEGLVAALSKNLGEFSREVAVTMRGLPKPRPPLRHMGDI